MYGKDIEYSILSLRSRTAEMSSLMNKRMTYLLRRRNLLILTLIDKIQGGEGGSIEELPAVEATTETPEPPSGSTRDRRPVDYYGSAQAHIAMHLEPTTFEEESRFPEKTK